MDFTATLRRVLRLILSPSTEWDAIAAEPAEIPQIYMKYAGPLIIASALATAIGISVVGGKFIKYPATYALSSAAVSILLGLFLVYVLAFVINALSSWFGGTSDMGQAFKLAAYSLTATWIAGLLNIIPALGNLAMLGAAYSLYLLFVGLPKLMKPAGEKAVPYTIAVAAVMIVMAVVSASVASGMLPSMTPIMRAN